jgi:hypothetical protein
MLDYNQLLKDMAVQPAFPASTASRDLGKFMVQESNDS